MQIDERQTSIEDHNHFRDFVGFNLNKRSQFGPIPYLAPKNPQVVVTAQKSTLPIDESNAWGTALAQNNLSKNVSLKDFYPRQ